MKPPILHFYQPSTGIAIYFAPRHKEADSLHRILPLIRAWTEVPQFKEDRFKVQHPQQAIKDIVTDLDKFN